MIQTHLAFLRAGARVISTSTYVTHHGKVALTRTAHRMRLSLGINVRSRPSRMPDIYETMLRASCENPSNSQRKREADMST